MTYVIHTDGHGREVGCYSIDDGSDEVILQNPRKVCVNTLDIDARFEVDTWGAIKGGRVVWQSRKTRFTKRRQRGGKRGG